VSGNVRPRAPFRLPQTRTTKVHSMNTIVPLLAPLLGGFVSALAGRPGISSRRATAVGAVAFGAFACGAFALAALAVGRLAVGRARFGRLRIDELSVGRLTGEAFGEEEGER
jgi:hypothetical protein